MLDTFINLKSQHMCSIALDVVALSWPNYRAANQRAYPKLATPSLPNQKEEEAETEEAKKRTVASAVAAAATEKKSRKIRETETKARRQNERQADQVVKNSQIYQEKGKQQTDKSIFCFCFVLKFVI